MNSIKSVTFKPLVIVDNIQILLFLGIEIMNSISLYFGIHMTNNNLIF
jgi:hypothetical protein